MVDKEILHQKLKISMASGVAILTTLICPVQDMFGQQVVVSFIETLNSSLLLIIGTIMILRWIGAFFQRMSVFRHQTTILNQTAFDMIRTSLIEGMFLTIALVVIILGTSQQEVLYLIQGNWTASHKCFPIALTMLVVFVLFYYYKLERPYKQLREGIE